MDGNAKMKNAKELCSAFTGGKDGAEKKTDLVKTSTALSNYVHSLTKRDTLKLQHTKLKKLSIIAALLR